MYTRLLMKYTQEVTTTLHGACEKRPLITKLVSFVDSREGQRGWHSL